MELLYALLVQQTTYTYIQFYGLDNINLGLSKKFELDKQFVFDSLKARLEFDSNPYQTRKEK